MPGSQFGENQTRSKSKSPSFAEPKNQILINNHNEENEGNNVTTTESPAAEGQNSSRFLISVSGVKYPAYLFKTCHEIEIPVRAHQAFVNASVLYLGDLIKIPFKEWISIPNLGRKSLEIVELNLMKLGLRFDMKIEPWPPSDLLDLRKEYETMLAQSQSASSDWIEEKAN